VNKVQKIILICAAFGLIGMTLFPPFKYINQKAGVDIHMGYSFISSPPYYRNYTSNPRWKSSINTNLLITQYIGLVLLTTILCLAFKNPSDNKLKSQLDNEVNPMSISENKSRENNYEEIGSKNELKNKRIKPVSSVPNLLFLLYIIIAVPLYIYNYKIDYFSIYYLIEFMGFSIGPVLLILIYNIKKGEGAKYWSIFIIVIWIFIAVLGTIGMQSSINLF